MQIDESPDQGMREQPAWNSIRHQPLVETVETREQLPIDARFGCDRLVPPLPQIAIVDRLGTKRFKYVRNLIELNSRTQYAARCRRASPFPDGFTFVLEAGVQPDLTRTLH